MITSVTSEPRAACHEGTSLRSGAASAAIDQLHSQCQQHSGAAAEQRQEEPFHEELLLDAPGRAPSALRILI